MRHLISGTQRSVPRHYSVMVHRMAIERDLGKPIHQINWPLPIRKPRSGRYVDLEILSEKHLADLWPFAVAAPESFAYLRYGPFADIEELRSTITDLSLRADQPFW